MKKKKHIGELVSVKFTDRKDMICGYVIDYNDEWTLMKYNPIDYVIDGYIIFRNKKIDGFYRGSDEKWRETVINLKGLQSTDKENIPLTDLETILAYLTAHYGVFQVYTKSDKACYLGRLKSIERKELTMDYLNTKGKWEGAMKFKKGSIRVIEFETDYINSLKLVSLTKG